MYHCCHRQNAYGCTALHYAVRYAAECATHSVVTTAATAAAGSGTAAVTTSSSTAHDSSSSSKAATSSPAATAIAAAAASAGGTSVEAQEALRIVVCLQSNRPNSMQSLLLEHLLPDNK
jgi:hypothetical protein